MESELIFRICEILTVWVEFNFQNFLLGLLVRYDCTFVPCLVYSWGKVWDEISSYHIQTHGWGSRISITFGSILERGEELNEGTSLSTVIGTSYVFQFWLSMDGRKAPGGSTLIIVLYLKHCKLKQDKQNWHLLFGGWEVAGFRACLYWPRSAVLGGQEAAEAASLPRAIPCQLSLKLLLIHSSMERTKFEPCGFWHCSSAAFAEELFCWDVNEIWSRHFVKVIKRLISVFMFTSQISVNNCWDVFQQQFSSLHMFS